MKHHITTLIAAIRKKLHTEYHDPVLMQQTAWWLIEALSGKKESTLLAQEEVELSDTQEQQLEVWINQLTMQHKPLQYILGNVPFGNLEIMVQPPILIPRPETEEWVLALIEELQPFKNQQLSILDIGTGTGCVALALAQALPNAMVTAVDNDPRALALACTNAHHNHLHNVTFIESDVYAQVAPHDRYDLIVSNPPYITPDEWKTLDLSVTQWENPHALMALNEGLAIIEKIIAGAPEHLLAHSQLRTKNIPQLFIEIGYTQGKAVQTLMEQRGFTHVELHKDIENKDRVVAGRLS